MIYGGWGSIGVPLYLEGSLLALHLHLNGQPQWSTLGAAETQFDLLELLNNSIDTFITQ